MSTDRFARGLALVGTVAAAVLLVGDSLAAPPTAPTPSLRITRFSRYLAPTTMGTSMGAGSAGAPTSARIDLGEEIALGWLIDVCHLQTVRIDLSGHGEQPAGEHHQERNGCYWLAGDRTLRPERTTMLRLTVSGTPVAGASAAPAPITALFEVQVARPVLEAVEPVIDQNTLRITFRVRNRGDADLAPSRVNVTYSVRGVVRGPSPLISEGTLRADRLAIPRGRTVDLGSMTLPDRRVAFSYDDVVVGVRIQPEHIPSLEAATGSFPHHWSTRTMTLTSAMLAIISRASSCQIRLNNYSAAATPEPVVANDSFVTLNLAGAQSTARFDIPVTRAVLRVTGSLSDHIYLERHYGILINQIVADLRNRDSFLSIRDGQVAIHLEFPNAGGPEVKIGELVERRFRDSEAPDINLGPFSADVLLTPGITSDMTRLTFVRSSVQVPPVSARLEGRFEGLNPFIRDTLNNYVHGSIVSQLSGILRRSDVKRAFEDGLATVTSAMNVSIIRRVEGRGDSIVLTYL